MSIIVKFLRSDVKTSKKKTKITEQTGTKILIRNVPFQATVQEITELFKYVYYTPLIMLFFIIFLTVYEVTE